MAEEWSTINVTRERALGREGDLLRRSYAEHREALERMAANAPSESLAREYVRLQGEIDQAVNRLIELERGGTAPRNAPPPASPPTISDATRSFLPPVQLGNDLSEPVGMPATRGTAGRVLLIAVSAMIVIAVLGYLVWKRSSRAPQTVVQEVTTTTTNATAISQPVPLPTLPPVAVPRSISVTPANFDYGKIRKGTRAVHKFELVNSTARPLTLAVSRSTCKCLWFQYPPSIPANGKATLGVTVDGGRSKKGAVKETVTVSAKNDPQTSASFDLTANVE